MYAYKVTPEDFRVDEVLESRLLMEEASSFHVYLLEKRNYTTERAVRHVAQSLSVPRKAISYAGTKDKKAVTTQHIVLKGVNKERVANLDLQDITLKFVGYAKRHFQLGDLQGNRFTITVHTDQHVSAPPQFYIPNYFDEQRFSTHNVQLGLHLMRKEFKEALHLLASYDTDFQEVITKRLEKAPNDYLGALRLLPKKTVLFYVHAVQSKFFNELLSADVGEGKRVAYSQGTFLFPQQLEQEPQQKELPLIGFGTDGYDKFLATHKLVARDFLMPSLPEFSLPGSTRKAYAEVRECRIEYTATDIAKISFILGKGSYATIVLRQLFATDEGE